MTLRTIAKFVEASRQRPLDAGVEQAATRAVVDWFGATIAGSEMQAPQIMRAAVVTELERGASRLVPDGLSVPARTAALVNGTAAHVAELDDIYRDGIYHPGAPSVAAALALAEQIGSSGRDFLRAVTIGYEVGNRIAAACQPAHYRFWHTTGTVGAIGAAAACADLLELDAERFAHALATATTMAAGLQQAFRADAMSKPLHSGHAAESGLLAALAAARGFTGALDVLDGPAGFGAAMADSPNWPDAIRSLGDDWTIGKATVKNHSCCGHTFAAVDAMLGLRQRLDPRTVERIEIATYRTAIDVAGNPDPVTDFEAKFSIAYCVAAALTWGGVRLRAFTSERLIDPVVRDLVKRTTASVDPAFDSMFPQRRAARVTVVDRSGKEFVRECLTRHGDPDDPLTDAELSDKFADLTAPVLGDAVAAALEQRLWALADLSDVRGLVAAELV